MEVRLKYNPYTRKKDFVIGSKTIVGDKLSNFFGGNNTEILNLTANFFQRLYNHCNDDIDFKFTGIQRDFDFLEILKDEYLKNNNPPISIKLIPEKIVNIKDRFNELKSLFTEMQNTTPFPDLKTEKLKKLFTNITNSDFEIAVVATMSSGKSTLINSMIGKELLPARNEATTAILARIHDTDGKKDFSAVSFDADGNELQNVNPLTLESMEKLNSDESISIIEIEGDIPNIDSQTIKLVLTDSPGPNNSRTDEHKNHTYNLISADYKPMILYVFNATQLETNDDESLLQDVAEAMKVKGKQSSDRFLFVLNKADELDPSKGESIEKKIEDLKKYLEKHGIYNPRIFPTSSYLAKVIRMKQNGENLSEDEEDFFYTKPKRFIKTKERHFSDYANFLSQETKMLLEQKIQETQNNGDLLQEALYYSGIPSIELAITEYLNKYALPEKISKGVNTFKRKLDVLGIEAEEKNSLKNNTQKIEELKKSIAHIKYALEQGEKGKEFRKRIENLSIEAEVNRELEKASSTFSSRIDLGSMKNSKLPPDAASSHLKKISNAIDNAQMKFQEDVIRILDKILMNKANDCVEEYQKYVANLVGEVCYESKSVESILGESAYISLDDTLYEYKETEYKTRREKIGTKQVKNEDFRFIRDNLYNIFVSPFSKKKKEKFRIEDVFEEKTETFEYINGEKYIEDKITPQIRTFAKNTRDIATKAAQEESKRFKNFFIQQISKLEDTIKNKMQEMEKQLSDKDLFEEKLEENKRNLEWLQNFTKKLDELLIIG